MSWVFENVNAYVNRLVRREIYSKQVSVRPLFYFISGRYNHNIKALLHAQKDPNDNFKSAVMLGGGDMGLGQRKKTLGSVGHELRYQKDDPTSGSNVEPGGATPTATVFSEDLAATAETRWTTKMWPLKIRESTIENTRGDANIASAVEEAVAMSFNEAFKNRQTDFWTGTLTQAQQDKSEWSDGILGITHQVSDGTTTGETGYTIIGRVDRTLGTATKLKSNVVLAADLVTNGHLPTTRPTLELIRKLRTVDSIGGLANLDPDAGDLVITTAELWNTLADEAEGQHTIYDSGGAIPEIGMTIGFKYPVIKKDRTYITYDPDCPSGELYMLSTGTWCYEIQAGLNYKIGKWIPKHETEEGGERYRWTNITLKDRLTSRKPWLQTKVKNLTTT